MDLYLIRRRHAFQPDAVEATVARASAEAEKVPEQLRHIRSYTEKARPHRHVGGPRA